MQCLNDRFTVDNDACDMEIGFALLQGQGKGPAKPVSCWLRTLTPGESAHDTSHRKDLAVLSPALLLHPYLERSKLIGRINYQALKWILILSNATRKLTQWRLCLFNFNLRLFTALE